jgi:hypothetical protein
MPVMILRQMKNKHRLHNVQAVLLAEDEVFLQGVIIF